MPLTSLELGGCAWVSDDSLWKLRKLPLTYLGLQGCQGVSDRGLEGLHGTIMLGTLTSLDLGGVWEGVRCRYGGSRGGPSGECGGVWGP